MVKQYLLMMENGRFIQIGIQDYSMMIVYHLEFRNTHVKGKSTLSMMFTDAHYILRS